MTSVVPPGTDQVQPSATGGSGPVVPRPRGPGDRFGNWALLMLIGIPIALIVLIIWQNVVKTSPMLNDPERIRGWSVVLRELPATLLLLVPVVTGLTLGVRAARLGATSGVAAIWLHSVALLFVLLIVLGGSAESVMTTRSATVKWLLFPVEVGVAGGALWWCLHAIRGRPG